MDHPKLRLQTSVMTPNLAPTLTPMVSQGDISGDSGDGGATPPYPGGATPPHDGEPLLAAALRGAVSAHKLALAPTLD